MKTVHFLHQPTCTTHLTEVLSTYQVNLKLLNGLEINVANEDLMPVKIYYNEEGLIELGLNPFRSPFDSEVAGHLALDYKLEGVEQIKRLEGVVHHLNAYLSQDNYEYYDLEEDDGFSGTKEECTDWAVQQGFDYEFNC